MYCMPVPGLAPDPGQRVLHCHVNWVKTIYTTILYRIFCMYMSRPILPPKSVELTSIKSGGKNM